MSSRATSSMNGRDPANWRHGVFDAVARISAILGVLVYIPSVLLSLKSGLVALAALDTVVLATLGLLLLFGAHVSYRIRATIFCLLIYVLGCGLLVIVGSSGQAYLTAFTVLSSLLLGIRFGIAAAVVSTLSFFLIGVLGVGNAAAGLAPQRVNTVSWLVLTINFSFISTMLAVGVGKVLEALERALRDEIRTRVALDEERALLQTFFDAVPDIVFTKDQDGRFRNFNQAAFAFSGLSTREEMQGATVFDCYPSDVAARVHAEDLSVLRGEAQINREVETQDRAGRDQQYLTLKVPLRDASGAVTGLVGISRNITERKKLEEQLRQSQKMDAVGQLAGGIAHDFNNLLTVILGYSELLGAQIAEGNEAREAVDAISDAATRAAELTRQLLAFSRKSMLQPRMIDLNTTITDTVRMLRRLLGETVRCDLVLGESIAHVRVDPGQLDQVLINLAVNARDAMPTGGTLTMHTAAVELDALQAERLETTPGRYVMITVSDTGIGMSAAVRERIFEPFYTTKGIGNGTGLGLATVFGIVRQSGGSIDVESEPGRGATFRIYLPVATDEGDTHGASGPVTVQPAVRNHR